jgi:hypothetical protein
MVPVSCRLSVNGLQFHPIGAGGSLDRRPFTLNVSARQRPNHEVICRSLLAFSFVTMPSVPDTVQCARSYFEEYDEEWACKFFVVVPSKNQDPFLTRSSEKGRRSSAVLIRSASCTESCTEGRVPDEGSGGGFERSRAGNEVVRNTGLSLIASLLPKFVQSLSPNPQGSCCRSSRARCH